MTRMFAYLRDRLLHFRGDTDLEEEMRVNLELQAESNMERGMTAIEARRQARLRLGDTLVSIEKVRDQELMTALESWYRDVVIGLRALRRTPVFCVTAVLTLAIGIGANTAVFTVLYGLLLRSLPVRHPRQLVLLGVEATGRPLETWLPWQTFDALRRRQRSFSGLSAWTWDDVPMKDSEGALRQYSAGMISGDAFSLLGMRPYLGRLIGPSDDVRAGPPQGWPVVLSYRFWRERYGGDVHAIGRQVRIGDAVATIVGVTPPGFDGVWPGVALKMYLPLQFLPVAEPQIDINGAQSHFGCSVVARLRDGVSMASATAEIRSYDKTLLRQSVPLALQQDPLFPNVRIGLVTGRTGIPSFVGHAFLAPLLLMQGLAAVVLVLCCVNVGGLMMSRVHTRRHEFAVRTALGGARWRLVRQYLTESLLIAVAGAALGVAAAWYGIEFLLRFFRGPMMFEGLQVQPDSVVFLVTGALAVVTTLLFGTVPGLRAGCSDPGTLLASRGAPASRTHIAGRAFIPAQVALSLMLVAVATLLSQSLIRLRSEHTGFAANHVTIQTPPFHKLSQHAEIRLDLYQRMVERLQQMPGMRSAAVTYYTPFTGYQAMGRFEAMDSAGLPPIRMAWNDVGPGYFRTMETRILSGREFQRSERRPDVCVLNQSAAARLFSHQSAVGRYVRQQASDGDDGGVRRNIVCRVVGVAEDAKFANLRDPPPPTVYFPVSTITIGEAGNLVFLMNADTEPHAISAYRTAISEIAPTVPLVLFVTMKEQMDAALGNQRIITIMSNVFAVLALFLSAIGLYGLLSSSVAQRTGEIGVRIALGAERGTVLRMILREALGLLGLGVVLGAAGLVFAVRFVQSMLFGLSAFDPATLLGTAAVLTLVTLFAGLVPAIHAASVDPMRALRIE